MSTDGDGQIKLKGQNAISRLFTKKSEIGKPKVAIDNIEKGILKDGVNFKDKNNIIPVGGTGEATEKGVEGFVLKLADLVHKEIGGAYFSLGNSDRITHMTIGSYKNNNITEAKGHGHAGKHIMDYFGFKTAEEYFTFQLKAFFHTHPSFGYSESDRLKPSLQDLESKENSLKHNSNLKFYILSNPKSYGAENEKIPY